MSNLLSKLHALTDEILSYELQRRENRHKLTQTIDALELGEKLSVYEDIFFFKAMNVTGISLQDNNLGEIQKNRYVQILAIHPDEDGKMKNISLGYYGKSDTLDESLKAKIIEFILRWRYEKSFYQVTHYEKLLKKLPQHD